MHRVLEKRPQANDLLIIKGLDMFETVNTFAR